MSWPERSHTLPDGRELRANYHGEPVGWVVHVVSHDGPAVAGRDMYSVLAALLDAHTRPLPDWLLAAAADLAARDTPLGRRYACACCGYLTLDDGPNGTYSICGVCFWEDDGVQFRDPDYEGGANAVSLNEARRNFRVESVSEPEFKTHIRAPLPEEHP
jgi:hypothetical protein